MRKNENGRSMIEMLGVLAIIGVLSVGGIYGYTVAMRKYKANEIVQTASMLATMAHAADAGEGKCVLLSNSGLEQTPGGVQDLYMMAAKPSSGVSTVSIGIKSSTANDSTITDLCSAVKSIAPKSGSGALAGYELDATNGCKQVSADFVCS